jgi:Abortive infection C-terminus
MRIPPSVIGTVSPLLAAHYTHAELNSLFYAAGFEGDAPVGNKVHKCQEWLRTANRDAPDEALDRFGRLIAEYMDAELSVLRPMDPDTSVTLDPRDAIVAALARDGLSYRRGGYAYGAGLSGPSRSLADRLRTQGVQALETEYQRAYAQIEADPPAALTAACAILETVCKTYLEAEGQPLPNKALASLWSETSAHLGLSPKDLADNDLKQILTGLSSIAVGVAALRTHKGSAHGHSDQTPAKSYRIEPRHARLAVHAAHTMALFVLETWGSRRTAKSG